MATKAKACGNCGNFKQYYEKGFHRFYRTEKGFCEEKNEIVCSREVCPVWRKSVKFRNRQTELAVKTLEGISEDLSVLRHILEEDSLF